MKTKIALLSLALLAIMGTAVSAQPENLRKVYKVSTADEFLSAIGSDRIIEIVPSDPIIITDAVKKLYDKGELDKIDMYDYKVLPEGIVCYDNYDGLALAIVGVENLTIRAKNDEKGAAIYSRPRYADVLKFIYCESVSLEHITLGHTDEGYCEDGVLGLVECTDVSVDHCDLFGCGTEGIIATNCNVLWVMASVIRDCSYHIMHLNECTNVHFDYCDFLDNRQFEQINVNGCEDVTFSNCTIYDNQGMLFNINSPVTMMDCSIEHNGDLGSLKNITMRNVTIKNLRP